MRDPGSRFRREQFVRPEFGRGVCGTKRGDFGLKWNKALEAGGVLVGEEVTLNVKAEVKK